MKHSLKALALLIVLGLAVVSAVAQNEGITVQNPTRINDTDILAEFDGGVITRKDLNDKISKLPPQVQGRYKTSDGQKQVLDIMATEELFMVKAIAMGIDKDPDVLKRIKDAEKQYYIQEFYKRNVSDLGIVTDAMKRDFYEQNKIMWYQLPNYTIEYIQAKSEDEAVKAKKDLAKGDSWEIVSDKYNLNSYAKGLKGKIKNIRLNGNIPGVGNDPELEKMIGEAQTNTIYGPVKTTTGWSVFRLIETIPGSQKTYEEVEPELEQRIRPNVDAETLTKLTDRLKLKYNVVIDSLLMAGINLKEKEANLPNSNKLVVNSSNPELQITVAKVLEIFSKISPQEQVFYTKGNGAAELINQELIRGLLYVEALDQNYLQYFADNPDYIQMKRYHVLTTAFRKLVLDTVNVTTEDAMVYYNNNQSAYTTPENRSIEILWFNDQKKAERARKLYNLAAKKKNTKKMAQIIKKNSLFPDRSVLANQYNNGTVTDVGPDEAFSKLIWETPVGGVSPVFTTARGDIVFFRVTALNPSKVTPFVEVEPRIYGVIKKEKEKTRQEEVIQELSTLYNLKKYPERITLLLSADELFEMANTAATQRNFKDAVVYYDQIISSYKNNKDDYKAFFMKAFLISEEVKDKPKALALFQEFVTKYPEGDLHESARFMIDVLSGKANLEFGEPDVIIEDNK